jgi:hypothetical protein
MSHISLRKSIIFCALLRAFGHRGLSSTDFPDWPPGYWAAGVFAVADFVRDGIEHEPF